MVVAGKLNARETDDKESESPHQCPVLEINTANGLGYRPSGFSQPVFRELRHLQEEKHVFYVAFQLSPAREHLRPSPFVHLVAPPAFPGRRRGLWADFPARWQPPHPAASSLSLPADPSGIWVPPQDSWVQATPPQPAPEVLPCPQGSRMVRFSTLPLRTYFSVLCSTVESRIGG